jgi:ceramide glucosyltransferase
MYFLATIMLFCTVATFISLLALRRVLGRGQRSPYIPTLPVTILKPLCGQDDDLEDNLETFFQQAYPEYELLFGVEGDKDPAVDVVRRLQARYPNVSSKLIIHDGKRGLNPKVSNLRRVMSFASHDLLVISDSNVAVANDYLMGLARHFGKPGVGLVTNLIVGVEEASLGARLDHLHLNGFAAGFVALTGEFSDDTATIGKSMMFRRSDFQRLGGMESIAALLAEDYVMGRMYREAGYEVVLDEGIIHNVCRQKSVAGFLKRHLRWSLLRSRLVPLLYPLELLLNPMAIGLFGAIVMGSLAPMAWAISLTLMRDTFGWLFTRGTRGLVRALPWSPLKDLMLIGVWAAAPFCRHVSWRGKRFRVTMGTRLYADS